MFSVTYANFHIQVVASLKYMILLIISTRRYVRVVQHKSTIQHFRLQQSVLHSKSEQILSLFKAST